MGRRSCCKRISIYAPAKGATSRAGTRGNTVPHFNPRSREGSDVPQDLHLLSALCISIHAPAKGATSVQRSYGQGCGISIHAPAKGATGSLSRAPMMWQAFQSTLPRRERRRLSRIRTGGGTISIHAPAKGATIQPFWTAERSPVFQSTLPRRERRDIPTPKVTPRHEISIHAPAKGATFAKLI